MCIYIYIIIPLRVLSRYIIHTTTHNFIPTYMILFFNNEINTKKKINCGLIPTHYKCICILVLTTLRMATCVAETCLQFLCDKISSIYSSVFVSLFKNLMYLINPYLTAFPYGNDMVLHFYQQQESSTTKTAHKVINKGLKTYV